jgi:predicted ester cyclase
METAILDLFSRESNQKLTAGKIFSLRLELVVESKQKQLLCCFFLKLRHNGATDFLGRQINFSVNTIYRFAQQRIQCNKMV